MTRMGLLLVILPLFAIACGHASPTLDDVPLPDTREEIEYFTKLPTHYGSADRTLVEELWVTYEGAAIRVQNVSSGDLFPPETTAGEALDHFAAGSDWEVLVTGGEGSRGWVRVLTEGDGVQVLALLVGDSSTEWLFSISAQTHDDVDAFAAEFIRRGIVPDTGTSYDLPQLIGRGRALELMLTGDEIDAATADRWGLVNRVVEPNVLVEQSLALAKRLAAGPSVAIEITKRIVDDITQDGLDRQLQHDAWAGTRVALSEDRGAGTKAFLEGRRPEWTGR